MIFKYLLPFIFNLLYLIVRLYNLIFNNLHVYLAYEVSENLRVLSQELVESVPAHRCPKFSGSDLNVSQFTWLLQAAQGWWLAEAIRDPSAPPSWVWVLHPHRCCCKFARWLLRPQTPGSKKEEGEEGDGGVYLRGEEL